MTDSKILPPPPRQHTEAEFKLLYQVSELELEVSRKEKQAENLRKDVLVFNNAAWEWKDRDLKAEKELAERALTVVQQVRKSQEDAKARARDLRKRDKAGLAAALSFLLVEMIGSDSPGRVEVLEKTFLEVSQNRTFLILDVAGQLEVEEKAVSYAILMSNYKNRDSVLDDLVHSVQVSAPPLVKIGVIQGLSENKNKSIQKMVKRFWNDKNPDVKRAYDEAFDEIS